METIEEIQEKLIDHLRREALRGSPSMAVDPRSHLAESGILDSLGFVHFVAFIQRTFGISLAPEDFNPENLATVERCARFILSRRAPGKMEGAGKASSTPAVFDGGGMEALPAGLDIRNARAEDIPAVALLWEELSELHGSYDRSWEIVPEARKSFAGSLEQSLSSPQVILVVAEEGKAIAGYCHGVVRANAPWFRERAAGTIVSISVSPKARSRGLGSRLVGAVLERFRAKGIDRVETLVSEKNEGALRFWEKAGFSTHARIFSMSLDRKRQIAGPTSSDP